MKEIEKVKISLMEKYKNFSVDEKSKGNYIIRSSAVWESKKFINNQVEDINELEDEEYQSFIYNALLYMYNDLMKENKDKMYDAVGLWITFSNGELTENAIDIETLKSMEEYGSEDIIPFIEFIKITLNKENESSEN